MMLFLVPLLVGLAQAPAAPVKEPALREELVKRMKAEQDARREWIRLNPANKPLMPEDRQRPEVKAALEKMAAIDQDNLAWFKGVVEKHGWPGKALVGADGAQGAFLIAQHAVSDLEFMNQCLGLLKEAYKAGDAEGQWVALMTDRLLVLREKKKQLYGTQLMAKDGKLVPQPIEDEANVDQRRKELGMPPLADYLKMVNERPAAPAKPPEK
jgi:hypothetical protein